MQPAQASFSTWLGKKNSEAGPPSPRGLCQHCLQQGAGCRPRLALPFVHLLSSDLTASIAVGRELFATRADGSNLLSLGFAQKANLAGFKASTSANCLTSAFPDGLSKKCQRKGSVGGCSVICGGAQLLHYIQEQLTYHAFPFPQPLRPRPTCSLPSSLPPIPVLPSCNHRAGAAAPQQVHMQSSSCDGGEIGPSPILSHNLFVFLLRDIHRHITERGTRVSRSP